MNTTIPEGRLENVRAGEAASRHPGADGAEYLWAWNEVGDTPWVTLVQIPSAAVFGPIYEAAFQRGLLNVAFSAVPLLLLLLLWRRLAPRYGALQAAAGYWAHGDWTHRASIRGEDELGQLGLAFDHMADQLQSSEHERQAAAQALRDRSQRLEAVQAVATEVARERDLTTLLQRLIAEATRAGGRPLRGRVRLGCGRAAAARPGLAAARVVDFGRPPAAGPGRRRPWPRSSARP